MPTPDPLKTAPRSFFLTERNRAEQKYRRLLNAIMKEIDSKITRCTTTQEVQTVLQGIINSPRFDSLCRQAAQQMATILAVGQKASWREAARASGQGRLIYQALMRELKSTPIGPTVSQIVEQNASLIKTVPQKIARRFSDLVKQRRFEGVRPEEIMQEIRQQTPHLTEYQARLIARTESAKASTALVQARAESMDLPFYEWHSVKDKRTRTAHREMSGVICRWSDPPNPEALFPGEDSHDSGGPYHPGCIYNCRCSAFPITKIDRIKFPVKVHVSGSIETINNLKAFKERFGITEQKGE